MQSLISPCKGKKKKTKKKKTKEKKVTAAKPLRSTWRSFEFLVQIELCANCFINLHRSLISFAIGLI